MPILLKGLFLESPISYSTWQQSRLTNMGTALMVERLVAALLITFIFNQ